MHLQRHLHIGQSQQSQREIWPAFTFFALLEGGCCAFRGISMAVRKSADCSNAAANTSLAGMRCLSVKWPSYGPTKAIAGCPQCHRAMIALPSYDEKHEWGKSLKKHSNSNDDCAAILQASSDGRPMIARWNGASTSAKHRAIVVILVAMLLRRRCDVTAIAHSEEKVTSSDGFIECDQLANDAIFYKESADVNQPCKAYNRPAALANVT